MRGKQYWSTLATWGGSALSAALATLAWRGKGRGVRSAQGDVHHWSSPTEQALHLIRDARLGAEEVIDHIETHAGNLRRAHETIAMNPAVSPAELHTRLAAVAAILVEGQELCKQLQATAQRVHRDADRLGGYVVDALLDPLTGAANRRAFDYELGRRVCEWHRQQTPLSLIMIDLDHFKQINDTYGHQAGDAVLREVVVVLRRSLREMDQVARYGGEEFGVIMPNSDARIVARAGEMVRRVLEQEPFRVGGQTIRLSASIGVASTVAGDDEASLIRRADVALYASKYAGRNCVHLHTGSDCRCIAKGDERVDCDNEGVIREDRLRNRDPLTGLLDATFFRDFLEYRLAEHARYGPRFCIMMVCLDDFARLDEESPSKRDAALTLVARHLKAALRSADLVTRFSSDRFAVLLPATALEAVPSAAERLRREVTGPIAISGNQRSLGLTLSIGACEAHNEDDAASLLGRVTEATDRARLAGGNRIYGNDQGMCIELDALALLPDLLPA